MENSFAHNFEVKINLQQKFPLHKIFESKISHLVFTVVYIFLHIFRYFMQYYNFQPLQQHNIYIFVFTKVYSLKTHCFLSKIPKLVWIILMYKLHQICKCTRSYTWTPFNINFPRLSKILVSCAALYIGTKHSFRHVTGICISCKLIKVAKSL